MASDTEITKVRIVIRHLLWQIREVRKDRDAAWEWVNRFANTLQYQDLEQDPDQYALAILAEARSFNDLQQRKQQMRWVRAQLAKEGVTNPTQEQLDEKWLEMYGQENSVEDGALVNQRSAGADSVRGTPSHRAPARPRAPFRNKEDFMAWAIDDGLDPVDANECWEATEERGGKDADGNTVKNMKAFARQWCRTRKDKRKTA